MRKGREQTTNLFVEMPKNTHSREEFFIMNRWMPDSNEHVLSFTVMLSITKDDFQSCSAAGVSI